MKLCKECAYCKIEYLKFIDSTYYRCGHPNVTDKVSGAASRHCEYIRDGNWLECRLSNKCGEEGRWFKSATKVK
jgi:hypothetical protein